MATWKKVVVSGSSAALKEITNDPAVATSTHISNTRLTGSFTGSFSGDGTGLTGVTGEVDIDNLTVGNAIVGSDKLIYSDNGTEKSITFAILSGSVIDTIAGDVDVDAAGVSSITDAATGSILSTLSGDVTSTAGGVASITDAATGSILNTLSGDVTSTVAGVTTIGSSKVTSGMLNNNVISNQTELAQGSLAAADEILISDGGTLKKFGVDSLAKDALALTTEEAVTVANDFFVYLDGSGTGETKKDSIADLATLQAGQGLVATSGVFDIELTANSGLAFTGTGGAGTLNIASDIPGNRTFSGDIITVNGDLKVAGTASFTNASNLAVADKYILLNSGSNGSSLDSGGIVIQGPTQDVGEIFGFTSGSSDSDITRRWAVANGFNANTSGDFTPQAFMANVVVGTDDTLPTGQYAKKGNIFVGDTSGTDPELYIYA